MPETRPLSTILKYLIRVCTTIWCEADVVMKFLLKYHIFRFSGHYIFLNQWMHACMHAKSIQSCPTLCDPRDYSLPGSSVYGIFQARILEWVAMTSSRGSSWPRDQTWVSWVSCLGRWVLYHCATWEAGKGPGVRAILGYLRNTKKARVAGTEGERGPASSK